MILGIGILLALGSAIALNWGFFVQHAVANALPPISVRHPLFALRALFTNPRWVLGYLVGIGGWGLYIAALRLAPISLVQAVSAGGIGVLALLVWRLGKVHPSRREQAAMAASVGGLAVVCVSFAAGTPVATTATAPTAAIWVAVLLTGAAVAWGPGTRLLRPGAGLGAAAGLLYAAGDVSTKGLVSGIGVAFLPVLLACHALGFVALQLAFQRGTALATAGLSTLLNNSLPIVAGLWLFHEHLPNGAFGPVRLAGFALVVLGAVLLARPEPMASDREMVTATAAVAAQQPNPRPSQVISNASS